MATIRKKAGAPAKRRGKNSNVITVDFTDVDAGGAMPTPDGIYIGTILSAEKDVSQAGNEMIVVRWKTSIGSTVFDRFVLVPQSLWVLRTALECLGIETPDGEFSFDPEDLVGQSCGIEITNEEYEEKDQPRVTAYLPEDAAKDVAETKKPAKKAKAAEPEEEEEEEENDEPVKKKAVIKKKAKPVEPDEEEEEEEEPAPAPKKKRAAKPEPEPEEEEEEEEPAPKKKVVKSTALRPGSTVTFEDEDGNTAQGVIESIDGKSATVIDDEDAEWEIPLADLTKA